MSHAEVQRTLFRMQLDPEFGAQLRRRAPEALGSVDLSTRELDWLCSADPRAIAADRGGARRAQFLRNVSSEFTLSLAALGPQALERFPRSSAFHEAVRQERPLPLALADHLWACAPSADRGPIELERAMARARRALRDARPPRDDEVGLAPWAHLVDVPDGTLAWASDVRGSAGASASRPPAPGRPHETLLLVATPEPPPFGLRHVEVERVSDGLARLLVRLEPHPVSRAAREEHAAQVEANVAELESVITDLLREGVLVGSTSSGPGDPAQPIF